jgi:hypothetical protein
MSLDAFHLWGAIKIINFTLKVFKMMPHGTLKFQIAFWAFRPTCTRKTNHQTLQSPISEHQKNSYHFVAIKV